MGRTQASVFLTPPKPRCSPLYCVCLLTNTSVTAHTAPPEKSNFPRSCTVQESHLLLWVSLDSCLVVSGPFFPPAMVGAMCQGLLCCIGRLKKEVAPDEVFKARVAAGRSEP